MLQQTIFCMEPRVIYAKWRDSRRFPAYSPDVGLANHTAHIHLLFKFNFIKLGSINEITMTKENNDRE